MGNVQWSWRRARLGAALALLLYVVFASHIVVNRYHLWREGQPVLATSTSSEPGSRAHCGYAYVVGDRRYTGRSEGGFCDGAYRLEPVTVVYWAPQPWVNELPSAGSGFAGILVAGVIAVFAGAYFAGGSPIGVLVEGFLVHRRHRPAVVAGRRA